MRATIASQHFVVLATVDADGSPDSAGVTYAAAEEDGALVLYVMTRRHLRKARDIAERPRVSLVVPIPRPILAFLPPATIQLRGVAELLPADDARGVRAFERFLVGRRILRAYDDMRRDGERRICFVRIVLDPVARSYMVGTSVISAARSMGSAAATTEITSPASSR